MRHTRHTRQERQKVTNKHRPISRWRALRARHHEEMQWSLWRGL